MKINIKYMAAALSTSLLLGAYTLSPAQDILPNNTAPEVIELSADKVNPLSLSGENDVRKTIWQGKKVAVDGRDIVSYHTNEKPLKGSKEFAAKWDNTTWKFASEENRDLFLKNPNKYVPEFGGFCPVSLAGNQVKVGHVNQYAIKGDKLYLTRNRFAKSKFEKDSDNFLLRAEVGF